MVRIPELPEVETFRRYIERTSLGQEVTGVEVRNKIVLGKLAPRDLCRAVEGSSFREARRIGKQLFLALSKGGWLTWHFGMTGEPVFFTDGDEPKYARVLFRFDSGALAFDDPRMLGRIGIAGSLDAFVRDKRLGPDALAIPKKEFLEIFGRAKGAVKPALMDQHKMAGVGNIYSDEILFQSRIDPRADLRKLGQKDLELIYRNMGKVLNKAIEKGADYSAFPQTYLLHHRSKGAPCPRCGGVMDTITLGGRTTYYCPACQNMP